MSAFLDELATRLDTTSGVGVFVADAGRNIFVGRQPAGEVAANCITLFSLPGSNPGAARDVAGLTFPRFQVLIRNTDYATGEDKLTAVRTALHGLLGVTLTNWYILRCHADQDGGAIGEDDSGRYEFSINFSAEIRAV